MISVDCEVCGDGMVSYDLSEVVEDYGAYRDAVHQDVCGVVACARTYGVSLAASVINDGGFRRVD